MSVKSAGRRHTTRREWSPEEDARLAELYADHKLADIAAKMGRGVSSVANRRQKLGLYRSPEQQARIGNGRFKPGHETWNKGKPHNPKGSRATRFQPGRPSNTWRPIGAERSGKDGILYRKVSDTGRKYTDWRPVHALVWEEHNGPLPEGHIVIFKDRDRRNIDPDNLEAITRQGHIQRNSIHRYPAELVSLMRLRGTLHRKINARRNKDES